MKWVSQVRERMRALVFRSREEAELEEELRFHLEMETQRLVREERLTVREAGRRAAIAFGSIERHKAEVRDARGFGWAEDFSRDLRLAMRRLTREPSFSVPTVVTLAIGIGAAAAIFTLVHSILLRPLPYGPADRLVTIGHAAPGFDLEVGGISDGLFLHYRAHNRVFEEFGIYHENEQNLTDGHTPERVRLAMASPGVFAALGVTPHLGRLFTEADADPEAATVVMISHDLWVRRYGADPAIVGGRIETNGNPIPVVGVLPPGFDFPRPETQVWYASGPRASEAGVRDLYRSAIARLRDGITVEQAERDLERLVAMLPDAYADVTPDLLREAQFRPVATPLQESIVGEVRPALMLLLFAAGLVLLIAWANAANLALLRAERQRREVAVSRALGARRRDLLGRFFSESLLLSALAGIVALAIAYAGVATRFGFTLDHVPRLNTLQVDAVVIGVVVGLSCLTGVLLALVPLLRTHRSGEGQEIRESSLRTTDGWGVQRTQRVLVAVQIALALALLVGSAGMVHSVWNLLRVDLGFDPRDTLTLELPLPFRSYPRYGDAAGFQLELLERLRAVPGVTAAEATLNLPLTPTPFLEVPLAAEGMVVGIPPTGTVNFATSGYFAAVGIPLLRGRAFESDDLAGDVPPVVVSEALGRALFGEADPIGQEVSLPERRDDPAYRVVGVVGDVPGESLTNGPARVMYLPLVRDPHMGERRNPPIPFIPREGATILLRTQVPPLSLASAVRRIVREMDPELPLTHIRTGDEIADAATARARLTMLLLLLGTGAALTLGVVGIYGAMSYQVGRRRREFGVRLALGARPADISRLVLLDGVLIVVPGIAAGLIVALALTRLMQGVLFGVSPTDPAMFTATSVLLLTIALAAVSIPARRARCLDPARTLRTD